ncbi:Lrp/AsnC family transcriptional regulator [Candidatus Woesearchaeota archaeon]|nr:Lrp/AsnC family transcriptional regulator [Candidatus Woesearchaeota archaeon]MBW3005373.1 Lrp/AsnC family transcriptional regulator [Candidatus Woesearchaeota archaeon]
MENNNLSSNEKKVLDKIGGCIKVDVPSLAEKTGLSKPTVRNIVNKLTASKCITPKVLMGPAALGLKLMTIYEISYPASVAAKRDIVEQHITTMLPITPNIASIIKINPTQALVISFYTGLEQKDYAFSKTMECFFNKVGKDFPISTKELWTRPAKDFYYDPDISKFLKGIDDFNKNSKK